MSQLTNGLVQFHSKPKGNWNADCLGQAWQAAEELGADRHKYFSAGGSAGGGLAFSVAEKLIADGEPGSYSRNRSTGARNFALLEYSRGVEEHVQIIWRECCRRPNHRQAHYDNILW